MSCHLEGVRKGSAKRERVSCDGLSGRVKKARGMEGVDAGRGLGLKNQWELE